MGEHVDAGARGAALLLQAALVAAYMAYGSTVVHHGTVAGHSVGGFWVLATLATVALGLQTAALTEIHGSTVRTCYVSGVLTNLVQGGVRRLRGREDEPRPLRLLAAVWLAYVAGATAGSYGLKVAAVWCLSVPLAALLVEAALDRRRARDG